MFKMGSHYSFGHLKYKLWPKEGLGVKLAIWLPTRKSWESTWFTVCRWRATYRWKALDEGYNFSLDCISIRGLLAKLWGSKMVGIPTWAISRLPLGSHRTKNLLDVGPMERCRVYYKGEGGGFAQVRAVMSLVCPCCPWLVLTPKVLQLRINHLVWVLCKPVWVNEACQLFLVPSRSSSTPLYPSKCCELGSAPRLLFLLLFSAWTHIWVFQGVGSASASWGCVSLPFVKSPSFSFPNIEALPNLLFSLSLALKLFLSLLSNLLFFLSPWHWSFTASPSLSPLCWISPSFSFLGIEVLSILPPSLSLTLKLYQISLFLSPWCWSSLPFSP